MRELFVLIGRYLSTAYALMFGDIASREDDPERIVALCFCILFTILALEMWANRINRGRR